MVSYADLGQDLNVSADTVRRDIEILHKNGLVSKVKGGAIARSKNPLTFQDRTTYELEEKDVIARKVQHLLKNGMTIFMDGGTTLCAAARHFTEEISIRVLTNNMALVPILRNFKNIDLIVLGGRYNKDTETNIGAKTCEDTELYVADLYLMGSCAISKEHGVTASDSADGEVKKSMLKSARKVIVLVNSSKVGTSEHFRVCSLNQVDAVISELPSDDFKLETLRYSDLTIL